MTDQPSERLPFGQEYEAKSVPDKSVRLNSKTNFYTKQAEQREKFEDNADAFMALKRERNKQALEFANQFMSLVKDRTLAENRTMMAQNIENEVSQNFLQLGLDINDDVSERNGVGSVMVCNLLFKIVLHQRDSINEMDYRIAKLEKQLSSKVKRESSNVEK